MLHTTRRSETSSNGVDSIRSHGVSLTVDLSQKRKDGGALLSWKSDYIWKSDKLEIGLGIPFFLTASDSMTLVQWDDKES
jgi:hypothetical protein